MTVTDQLLRVFRVDQQIDGLQTRLRAAERFLNEQGKQLQQIGVKKASAETQLRQVTASAANAEVDIKALDERIDELRERMNSASTNKEYKAMLNEVNTLKEQRGEHESKALELLEKAETLKSQVGELDSAQGERKKLEGVATDDRDKRASEIKDKLESLKAERTTLVADVPASALAVYDELRSRLEDEEPMAPIEIADRRRHEFHCGSCMMSLPVEAMASLLSHGGLTQCVSCGVILFVEESTREAMTAKSKK